jgi:hypothetical protein
LILLEAFEELISPSRCKLHEFKVDDLRFKALLDLDILDFIEDGQTLHLQRCSIDIARIRIQVGVIWNHPLLDIIGLEGTQEGKVSLMQKSKEIFRLSFD